MARMTLYLNDAEHARLAEVAEAAGVSRSQYLRAVIMGVSPTQVTVSAAGHEALRAGGAA